MEEAKKGFTQIVHKEPLKTSISKEEHKKRPKAPIVTILDNIRARVNVGSIFRVSDAINVEKVYLTGFTSCPPQKKIAQISRKVEEYVEWEYFENALELVKKLKKGGYTIYCLEQCKESQIISNVNYKFPLAIIVGFEKEGVQDLLVEESDVIIQIPMLGMKESLNVSTAYAITAFEIAQSFYAKDFSNIPKI